MGIYHIPSLVDSKVSRMVSDNMAIRIVDLEMDFGEVKAVDGLSLDVRKGELFGLLGPNGAGKTTTINVLVGLLKPTGGKAEMGGYDIIDHHKEITRLIGVCPQETAVFPYLTARENIEFFGDLHGILKDKLKKDTEGFLKMVGLEEHADRKVGTFSGGMKHRVSLLMALISHPEISFLDEPTVGLDPNSRHAVWDFIKGFKDEGKTVILTTHYMEEAEHLCDRIGIIDRGKLIVLGTPQELMEKHGGKNLEDVFIALTGRGLREDD